MRDRRFGAPARSFIVMVNLESREHGRGGSFAAVRRLGCFWVMPGCGLVLRMVAFKPRLKNGLTRKVKAFVWLGEFWDGRLLVSGRGRAGGRLSVASVWKGIWWMPWHREAKKDVALCDKLRGGESSL